VLRGEVIELDRQIRGATSPAAADPSPPACTLEDLRLEIERILDPSKRPCLETWCVVVVS
jgi:hypothetical protein